MALSNAARQRRYRARHSAARRPVHYRRAHDRRSRLQRWNDAVRTLRTLRDEYRDWLDTLPEALQESAVAAKLGGGLRAGPYRPGRRRAAARLRARLTKPPPPRSATAHRPAAALRRADRAADTPPSAAQAGELPSAATGPRPTGHRPPRRAARHSPPADPGCSDRSGDASLAASSAACKLAPAVPSSRLLRHWVFSS